MFSVFVLLSRLLDSEGEGTMFSFNSEDDVTVVFQIWKPLTQQQCPISEDLNLQPIWLLKDCVFWTMGGVKHDLGSKLEILVLKRCVRTNHETSVCI
jgi:hypothetical protein